MQLLKKNIDVVLFEDMIQKIIRNKNCNHQNKVQKISLYIEKLESKLTLFSHCHNNKKFIVYQGVVEICMGYPIGLVKTAISTNFEFHIGGQGYQICGEDKRTPIKVNSPIRTCPIPSQKK